jgi:Family of unknown function (DUF5317)
LRKIFLATYLWILLLPTACNFIGAASNQLVLISNHDKFPVLMNEVASARIMPLGYDEEGHVLMTPQTHLNALADIFDFHNGWGSIGDLLIDAGTWLQTVCPFVWGALVIKDLIDLKND